LPSGNRPQARRKQSISRQIVSFCVSLRSYMLDVVAIFAAADAENPVGLRCGSMTRRPADCQAGTDRIGDMP
jgi:hypothetical protein